MPMVELTINGVKHQVDASEGMVLLDYLRKDLGLTGTKQSCDRKGQCGACMVIVNDKAVRSCLTKIVGLEGASVITIEGLGTPENPHLIQEAFCLAGAIQCGFCTPGMIMSTKALLDANPRPSTQEIKKALAGNLCRCTGYKKIIDAVKLASKFINKEITPEQIKEEIGHSTLGRSHIRPTALIKACGTALFNDDIPLPPGALEVAAVHSTEHHATIKFIDTAAAEKMPGVVGILRASDIKGTNRIRQFRPDEPVLCEDIVRHLGEPIVAVVAETREQARAAAKVIRVDYEPLPVQITVHESLAPGAYTIHAHAPDNICAAQPIIKGDADKAFEEAHAVVEGVFATQTNHQAPLEPEVSSAYFDGDELVVVGRSITIHTHKSQLEEALGYQKIRYIEAFSGGQFGIKTWITSEGIAAAAAIHFGRPVRYAPSMAESIAMTSKRHAYNDIKTKLGVDKEGRITAFACDFLMDKGAYTNLGHVILMRSIGMMSGSYYMPNIKAMGRSIYTNNSPGGTARGAGPPQTAFALECIVDMMAEKIGVDPLEFRRNNSLQPGQTKATGMIVKQWDFLGVAEKFKPLYDKARKAASEANSTSDGKLLRGVGIAAFSFGIGGIGDLGKVRLEVDPDDGISLYAAVADPGEGNDSMLAQIISHKLGVPLEKIRLHTRDTDTTYQMGPAASSRMTFIAGNTVLNAVSELEQAYDAVGARSYKALVEGGQPTKFEVVFKNPGKGGGLDKLTGQGETQVSEVHNIQMAEVEVNTETGETRVLKMTCVVDSGTIINPQAFEGQVEGGMDQGVGFALREEFVPGVTTDYMKFKFPTMRHSFDMEVVVVETPRYNGPLGATGIGEMTMISTAPAVVNAIYNACGARVFTLPAKPEKVLDALQNSVG